MAQSSLSKKALAIITARGGSKRIPNKNIKLFLGKPIIKYSIEAAIKSNCFDEIMVSTDSEKISKIAKDSGALVPFMRSKFNSGDYSTTADVLIEVINSYLKLGKEFDYVCCIYPTAPFLKAKTLKSALKKMIDLNCKSVLPVVKFSYPILRSFKMENNKLELNWPNHLNTRSQDLPNSYHDAGQFYFFKTDFFLSEKKLFTDDTYGIEMPETEVQDIDNMEDWTIAEMKYKILNKID